VHIASALGKPVVALFGGEDPRAWHPWGVSYRLLRPASRDVRGIEVEEVRRAFAELSGRDAL
jgi:ADP-heptose:LPS heptosyltransferase